MYITLLFTFSHVSTYHTITVFHQNMFIFGVLLYNFKGLIEISYLPITLFLISIYFSFYLTLCPVKRGLFHIPNFEINFLKIKKKKLKKGLRSYVRIPFDSHYRESPMFIIDSKIGVGFSPGCAKWSKNIDNSVNNYDRQKLIA